MNAPLEYIEPMQSDTIGKLADALAKVQAKLNGVSKGQDNPFFKSKYADLHECIEAAREPLAENGLAVIQTLRPGTDGKIGIVTTLVHSSGEWIRGLLEMKPKKDDDQGRGSSITYGRRYSFAAIIGLAQKDDDGNGSVGNGEKPKDNGNGKTKDQSKPSPEDEAYGKAVEYINSFCEKSVDEFLDAKPKMLAATEKYSKEYKDKLVREIANVEQYLTEGSK